jgi:hypothetical protein
MTQLVFGERTESAMLVPPPAAGGGKSPDFSGIAPGQYVIEAGDPPRKLTVDLANSQQIDFSGSVSEASVSGTLRLASGQPVRGQLTLVLENADGGDSSQQASPQYTQMIRTTSSGDHFAFDDVPPGRWTLWAAIGDKPLATVSITINGRRSEGGDFQAVGKPLRMDVMLADVLTRVTGLAVKDGKGFPGAMVVLVPRNPAALSALVRRDQSDTDGTFNLRDVAPGQYTVIAIEDGWSLDWANPEVLGRYMKKGVAASIGSGAEANALPVQVPVQQK